MKKPTQHTWIQRITNVFNVKYWLDFERIKAFTIYLASGMRSLFVPAPPTKGSSFAKAVKTYKLSEQDLLSKQNALYRLSLLMTLFALLMLVTQVINCFLVPYKVLS